MSSTSRRALGRGAPAVRAALASIEVDVPRRREFSRRLRVWFRKHGRDLPWRRTRDPYHVLVSELMLQQTQVSRVVDYYERFLTRFPTLAHVAEAPQRHVVEAWAGLGYYARARNLHALAYRVTRDGATIPDDPAALRELPGIGAYTAGAVASFAYERRAALVDTNVARVLHRAFMPARDPRSSSAQRAGWSIAEQLLPRTGRSAWVHNQALMELGALICTARVRHCERCPVARLCDTRRADHAAATVPIVRSARGADELPAPEFTYPLARGVRHTRVRRAKAGPRSAGRDR